MFRLRSVRTLQLPITRLYRYWTEPQLLQRWLLPGECKLSSIEIDAEENGWWRLHYQEPAAGNESLSGELHGQFRILTAPTYLLTSWYWQQDPQTTLIELRLHALDARTTELDLRHSTFADAAIRDQHRQFWHHALRRLAEQH